VGLLRDNRMDTYWQSDGYQPHNVNIQFRRKTTIHSIALYFDFMADESYTPSQISVRIGSDFNDLREIENFTLNEPTGWLWFQLHNRPQTKRVRAFMIQIAIIQNHQNGRDTHLRQLKVFSKDVEELASWNKIMSGETVPTFSTIDVKDELVLR